MCILIILFRNLNLAPSIVALYNNYFDICIYVLMTIIIRSVLIPYITLIYREFIL